MPDTTISRLTVTYPTEGLTFGVNRHKLDLSSGPVLAELREVFQDHGIRLIAPLASSNGCTVVYRAEYQREQVAVKLLIPAFREAAEAVSAFGAFKVECEKTMILSRSSAAVVQVLEYGDVEVAGASGHLRRHLSVPLMPYLITEYAPLGSLDRARRPRGGCPPPERTNLLLALANATEGIKEAHRHQVAHRDIKPQNILLFGPSTGKIADFGIARWRMRLSRRFKVAQLTPLYASPEQAYHALTGKHEALVDLRGDVYSWAVMLHELVSGVHPFAWAMRDAATPATSQQSLLKAIAANDRRGFLPSGDEEVDRLVQDCTAPLDQRIDDIAQANHGLRRYIDRMLDRRFIGLGELAERRPAV